MIQIRDLVKSTVPWWLSDRGPTGPSTGYRVLYAFAAIIDGVIEWMMQGIQARMPGQGTPTALGPIGNDRRLVRGIDDTDDNYAARLRGWLTTWKQAGTVEALTLRIHEYLPGRPQVRVVTRGGKWCTCALDGTVTRAQYSPSLFNWDSISNPERVGNWSDIWVIIYPVASFADGNWGDADGDAWGENGLCFGMSKPVEHTRMVRTLLEEWKGAHSKIVCIIFASDGSQFNPTGSAPLMPDGTWGSYAKIVAGASVPSRPNYLRYLDNEGML